MSDPVRAAMESASFNHVIMSELGEAAGARLAELTGAEWGLVTAGSATGSWPSAPRPAPPPTIRSGCCNYRSNQRQAPRSPGAGRTALRLRPCGSDGGCETIEVDDVAALKSGSAEYDVVANCWRNATNARHSRSTNAAGSAQRRCPDYRGCRVGSAWHRRCGPHAGPISSSIASASSCGDRPPRYFAGL